MAMHDCRPICGFTFERHTAVGTWEYVNPRNGMVFRFQDRIPGVSCSGGTATVLSPEGEELGRLYVDDAQESEPLFGQFRYA